MERCAPSISLCAAFTPICPTRGLAAGSWRGQIPSKLELALIGRQNKSNYRFMAMVLCEKVQVSRQWWQWHIVLRRKERCLCITWCCANLFAYIKNVRHMVLLVGFTKLSQRDYSMASSIHHKCIVLHRELPQPGLVSYAAFLLLHTLILSLFNGRILFCHHFSVFDPSLLVKGLYDHPFRSNFQLLWGNSVK